LNNAIRRYADKKGLFQPYEVVLAENLELMRLSHKDNMGVGVYAQFALLNLGFDDKCHNMIKWWVEKHADSTYGWSHPPPSSEGDWLYKTGQDKMEYLEIGSFTSMGFLVKYFTIDHYRSL
jgi:hypothetical protein